MNILLTKKYVEEKYPNLTNRVTIGGHTYGPISIHEWGEGAKLDIGKYCAIANNVEVFLGGNHRPDWVTIYPFSVLWLGEGEIEGHPATKGNITIGNDVWIGDGARIMSGVKIGSGAVIGNSAVVAKDIPPYAIAVGNPAKVVKYRFEPEKIEALLKIAWWNWNDSKIRKSLHLLCSRNINDFINIFLDEK